MTAETQALIAELRGYEESPAGLFTNLFGQAADALAAQAARIGVLQHGLQQAADWFFEYEVMHTAKGTTEGDEKARINKRRSEWCDDIRDPPATLSSPAVGEET